MPRKQKQKQKQSVSQKQKVSQRVVVNVGTTPRRRAPRKGGAKKGGVGGGQPPQPPFFMPPPQQPFAVSPFLEQSAFETNRRIGAFGEQLGGIMSQQEARDIQMRKMEEAIGLTNELARRMLISRPEDLPKPPSAIRTFEVGTSTEEPMMSAVSTEPPMMTSKVPKKPPSSVASGVAPSVRAGEEPAQLFRQRMEEEARPIPQMFQEQLPHQAKFAQKALVEQQLGVAPTGSPFAGESSAMFFQPAPEKRETTVAFGRTTEVVAEPKGKQPETIIVKRKVQKLPDDKDALLDILSKLPVDDVKEAEDLLDEYAKDTNDPNLRPRGQGAGTRSSLYSRKPSAKGAPAERFSGLSGKPLQIRTEELKALINYTRGRGFKY